MNRSMDKLALEERRAYFRAWRAAHKENTRRYAANYWKRRAAKKQNEGKEES